MYESYFLNKFQKEEFVAVKTHFGEKGNKTHLSADLVSKIIDVLINKGLNPVLVETSTLYRGERQDAVSHLKLAYEHGFKYDKVKAPIIMLDGLYGTLYYEEKINGEYVKRAKIGILWKDFRQAIFITHFKGHLLTGFGGNLKNVGMGISAKPGKLEMHSTTKPFVKKEKCIGCKLCSQRCAWNAIEFNNNGKAEINKEKCTGCAGCVSVCPTKSINIKWDEDPSIAQKKLAEYVKAILKNIKNQLYITFLINITRYCDCYPMKDNDIVYKDIGVLISDDPVASDQAGFDMLKDIIKNIHPKINPEIQLIHAEKLGIGTRNYKLITL